MPNRPTHLFRTILTAGMIAGALDIAAACIKFYFDTGRGPEGVLRFVASGYFGRDAFTADGSMMIWGLFFHFLIAIGWAAIFGVLSIGMDWMTRKPMLSGAIYGLIIWTTMNFLIVPTSEAPKLPMDISNAIIGAFIIVACVGWPIAGVFSSARKTRDH